MFLCTVYLYRLNADERSTIDIMDLVTVDGKLNDGKFIRLMTWIVSTWGFIYLIASQNLTEWYFIGYMGGWVANALIAKAIPNKGYQTQVDKNLNDYPHEDMPRNFKDHNNK
jgi:hypothetical protein